MSRWLVIQLWASNVSVVFLNLRGLGGWGGHVTGGRSIEKCPHSSVAHPPPEKLLRNLHTHTPSANPYTGRRGEPWWLQPPEDVLNCPWNGPSRRLGNNKRQKHWEAYSMYENKTVTFVLHRKNLMIKHPRLTFWVLDFRLVVRCACDTAHNASSSSSPPGWGRRQQQGDPGHLPPPSTVDEAI